jgi:hypothetical protein
MDMVRSSVIPLGGTCCTAPLSRLMCCNDRQSESSLDVIPGGKLRDLIIQEAAAGGE